MFTNTIRSRKSLLCFSVLLGLLGCLLASPSSAFAQNADPASITPTVKCSELVGFTIPDSKLTITKAEPVAAAPPNSIQENPFSPSKIPAAMPSYCRVEGVIDQRTGVDGNSYGIRFALALPDRWTGQFLFQGGGGLNGSVPPPYGTAAAGNAPALARSMAVVSTDTGHEGAVFDATFMKDQQASLDFAQDAVGRVALIAKQIISHYYGQKASHSYYDGCSTGGREGMLVSQRYPQYFDGVVSGDPAMDTGYSNLGLAWAAVAFNQIAPKDSSGKPIASEDYSDSDKKLLIKSLLDTCDALDGLKDGMIFNLQACHYDPAVLTCKGQKTDSCLTAQQVHALKTAMAGPKDSLGHQVYPPFPYDTGIIADSPYWIPGIIPGKSNSTPFPKNFSTEINVDQREAEISHDAMQLLTDTNLWTNLSTFSGRGGKLIFYHGDSDPWFSPLDTFGYYQRLAENKDNGSPEKLRDWSRFFFVPGMSHCGGGPATLDRFDLLTAVVDWVEKGTAPDYVVATGRDFPGRSRPLCAYPDYAQYKGQGNSEDAASFECKQGPPMETK